MREMLRDLPRMAVFATVAREGSFTAAAKSLGLGKSVVSDHLAKLEDSLGARLLNRTTRRFSLTEAGEDYLVYCQQVLEAAEQSHARALDLRQEPSGLLRVTTTTEFGALRLAPLVRRFVEAHPKVGIDLVLENGLLDLVERRIDLAIRFGTPRESSLIGRKLGSTELIIFAAPAYLAARGRPETAEDLGRFDWVLASWVERPEALVLRDPKGQAHRLRRKGRLFCNTSEGVRALVAQGLGLGVAPAIAVEAELAAGELVRVLPDHHLKGVDIYALYPAREHLPLKVRAFLDFLASEADWGRP